MTTDGVNTRLGLLQKDYENTSTVIGRIDGHGFTIRSWSITAITGLIALSLSIERPVLALLALVPTMILCALDVLYRAWHGHAVNHSRQIEREIARLILAESSTDTNDYRFGVGHALHRPKPSELFAILRRQLEYRILYGGLVLVAGAAAIFGFVN